MQRIVATAGATICHEPDSDCPGVVIVRLPVGDSVREITSVPFIPRHDPAGPEAGTYCGGGGGAQDDKAPIARVMRIGSVYFISVWCELIARVWGWGVTVGIGENIADFDAVAFPTR